VARAERGNEAEDIVPVRGDDIGADALAEQGLKTGIGRRAFQRPKTAVGEVAQARAEPEPEQSTEREDMIGRTARIGVMLVDGKRCAMMQEPVEHIGGFVRCRR